MESERQEYEGHRIELREREGEREGEPELLIDNAPVRYGQLPNGLYFLHGYAFDWRDSFCRLIDRLLRQKGIQGALQNSGIDSDELRRCLEEYFRKPAPGQPPHLARANLGDRLRSIIRDERTLQDVMREIEREGV